MGIKTVIESDYDGRVIDGNTPASTITIETPGQDTISFEAYLDETDLESIQQLPIASNGTAAKQQETTPDSLATDDKAVRKQLSESLEKHLKLTTKSAKDAERAWFSQHWNKTKESKDPIKKELEQADLAQLKKIVPVTEQDKDTLLDIVDKAPNLMNVAVISIVRQLRGEKLPS
ncbi:MAG: hypothetical protein ACRDTW_11290 [Rhodococcus qingshengii]